MDPKKVWNGTHQEVDRQINVGNFIGDIICPFTIHKGTQDTRRGYFIVLGFSPVPLAVNLDHPVLKASGPELLSNTLGSEPRPGSPQSLRSRTLTTLLHL